MNPDDLVPPSRRQPSAASRMQKSALADSLRVLLGGVPMADMPADVAALLPRAQGMSRGDTIYLSPNASVYGPSRRSTLPTIPSLSEQVQPDVRGVTLHEAGHRYQESRPSQQRSFPTFERAASQANLREGVARRNALTEALSGAPGSTPTERAVARLSPYVAEDPSAAGTETYADAFANAWDFLSRTAAQRPTNPRQLLAEYEAMTPGTGTIVMNLLREKLFRGHPYAKQGVPADVPVRR